MLMELGPIESNKQDRILYDAIVRQHKKDGIVCRSFAMIQFGMIAEVLPYWEVLRYYSDWSGTALEIVHSAICYEILKAGLCVPPEDLARKYIGELVLE